MKLAARRSIPVATVPNSRLDAHQRVGHGGPRRGRAKHDAGAKSARACRRTVQDAERDVRTLRPHREDVDPRDRHPRRELGDVHLETLDDTRFHVAVRDGDDVGAPNPTDRPVTVGLRIERNGVALRLTILGRDREREMACSVLGHPLGDAESRGDRWRTRTLELPRERATVQLEERLRRE